MLVPKDLGRLRRRGVQGLSPDELRVEPALLQELLMGPHLQRGRGGRWSSPTQPRAHSPQRTSSLGSSPPKPEPLRRTQHRRSQVAAGASVLVSRAGLCKNLWIPLSSLQGLAPLAQCRWLGDCEPGPIQPPSPAADPASGCCSCWALIRFPGPPLQPLSPGALPQQHALLRTLPCDTGGLTAALLTARPPPGEETGAWSGQGLLKGKNS